MLYAFVNPVRAACVMFSDLVILISLEDVCVRISDCDLSQVWLSWKSGVPTITLAVSPLSAVVVAL
jgi:hypothetical protein